MDNDENAHILAIAGIFTMFIMYLLQFAHDDPVPECNSCRTGHMLFMELMDIGCNKHRF
jgi:hypothetical protein